MKKLLFGSFLTRLLCVMTLGFVAIANAQTPACNQMSTPQFITCANDVITYTSNINAAGNGKNITWTITDIASGAFFVESGTQILHKVATGSDPVGTPNSVQVNVGPNAGSLTVLLSFDGQGLMGSCSSSRIVRIVKVEASAPPILCFGAKTTITAKAMTRDTKDGPFFDSSPYQYTLNPGAIVNNTEIFTNVAPGDYTVTAKEGLLGVGCGATTNIHIEGVPDLPLIVNCPVKFEKSACEFLDQAAVDAAFKTWMETFKVSGGTPPVITTTNPQGPLAPNKCGGEITVTWTVKDACNREEKCVATFKVNAAPLVTFEVPAEKHIKSCDQDAINAAYETFKNGFKVAGGCAPKLVGQAPAAPLACGGEVLVKYIIQDKCYVDKEVSAKFIVDKPDAVTYEKPADVVMDACDQTKVADAYAAFLAKFKVGGGCAPKLVGITPVAPAFCGGEVTVDYTVEDKCFNTIHLIAKFKVNAVKEAVVTVPADKEIGACAQADIDAAYKLFVAGFKVEGGCNAQLVGVAPLAPLYCGGDAIVKFIVKQGCFADREVSAKFVVKPTVAPRIVLCPEGKDLGCNPELIPAPVQLNIESVCDFTVDVKNDIKEDGCNRRLERLYTVKNACGQEAKCLQIFTWKVDKTAPVITLVGPANIDLGKEITPTDAQVEAALGTATVFDLCGATLTHVDSPREVVNCLVKITRTFNAKDDCGNVAASVTRIVTWSIPGCGIESCTLGYWKNHTDRWCKDYTTCTLYGDVFVNAKAPYATMTLAQSLAAQGGGAANLARQSVAAILNSCQMDYKFKTSEVVANVNKAWLTNTEGTYGSYLDQVNNGFGNEVCPMNGSKATTAPSAACLAPKASKMVETPKEDNATGLNAPTNGVVAYPNPFKGSVNFDLYSPESGKATLEIFNLLGQRIATPFNGHINAGETIKGINLNVNKGAETLIYRFNVNGNDKGFGRIINQD